MVVARRVPGSGWRSVLTTAKPAFQRGPAGDGITNDNRVAAQAVLVAVVGCLLTLGELVYAIQLLTRSTPGCCIRGDIVDGVDEAQVYPVNDRLR